MEKDAKERAKRRRENKVLADALKEKGNEAFVRGDYETAILCYSEGLEKLKDMKVLYTNRAQAYIKLGDYRKALVDCDWALKFLPQSSRLLSWVQLSSLPVVHICISAAPSTPLHVCTWLSWHPQKRSMSSVDCVSSVWISFHQTAFLKEIWCSF
ncbi:Tetratricopeptide repeat protein 12 [Camelus dromedarius]|uniref:Tetratricopeptide repeat protein 12 n=1 Tax=Camelus dromedarius TaxID=9838 RepID=A0A5N4C7B7_CAMDR|nr:Tetratricopeptide repeat protein 12 [Camelus dromedarius]